MIRRITSRGFTIVELMVTIAAGGVVMVAAIGLYLSVLSQSPLLKTRNTLSTNLQTVLNRINDDVRRSSNVSVYNLVSDPDAPTAKTGYDTVPGPDPDTDDKYFWRMGEHRLLLNQTPVGTDGNLIYDNAQYAVGKKDTIIYYVRDNALYRRLIAAPYGTNSATTTTCTRVTTGGCIDSDIKVVGDLKASLGDAAFKVVYYDRSGNPINYSVDDGSGNQVPDYSGFPLARSIGVTVELESGEVVGSQKVGLSNSMRMQFRSDVNVVPTPVVNPPYVPPTNGLGSPGLMIGPGGLAMYDSNVQGGDIYVRGQVSLGFNSRLGGSPFSYGYGYGSSPINLNVANVGCGSGSTYPQLCTGTQPINATAAFALVNGGKVCARGQADPTNITGLIAGCVPPDVDLPVFDKAAFVTGMNNGTLPGSTISCSNGNSTVAANRTYTGNVSFSFFCNVTISGSTYITGNLTTSNTTIKVAESVGKVRPIIVVNGKINAGTFTNIKPNSYGTAPYFISFFSSDSACSNSSSCTSITPANLKATLDNYTGGNSPIYLSNTTASGSSFYSYFGEASLDFFSQAGAVAGQRVKLTTVSQVLMNGSL